MKVKIIFAAVFIFWQTLLPGKALALSLQECIDSALRQHPDLIAAAGRIAGKQAAIKQAGADRKLQLSAGSSYTQSGGSGSDDRGAYNSSIQAEQLLYDFGKSNLNVKAAAAAAEAAEFDYLTVRDTVIANVRAAYYGLNQSVRQHHVARTRYDNYRQRLEWAEAYYEAGTKAKIEVTKAKADLANSRLALVKTESAMAEYAAELASAMGQPLRSIDGVEDVLAYRQYDIAIEDAVDRALANRPELAAGQQAIQYAQLNLSYQRKGLAASVTAGAGYEFAGSSPFAEHGWNANVSLTLPLWDGGLTHSKISAAEADLNTAIAEQESTKNSVRLAVRKGWEALTEARATLTASLESEAAAKETFDLAQARYQAGVGDSLEISDAVEGYASAQLETVAALYQYKHAQLELEKAMGGLSDAT